MNTNTKLRELLDYILSVEEKARGLYEHCLAQLRDPEIIKRLQKIRDEEAERVRIARELLGFLGKYETAVLGRGLPQRQKRLKTVQGLYITGGILLGLSTGIGNLIFKFFLSYGRELKEWLQQEWVADGWAYLSLTAGTILGMGLLGWIMGAYHVRLMMRNQDLAVKTKVLEDISARDPLTGLYNFGYIRERLFIEIERAKRYQTPLSCLMLDIDNLKAVNDSYGHAAGDAVIRYVAQLIQKEIRIIDTPTRYGGDEFFIILPVTPPAGASTVGERIRYKIKQAEIAYRDILLKTTVSLGIASFPSLGVLNTDSLVEMADKALYQAKRAGRDQLATADLSVAV